MEKCSGKYDDNKVAARYVYQMADEVINQLAGVAVQLREMRANSPENFQELLDEWNEEFPQSLGAYGTPKNIALKLERQSLELKQLRDELDCERDKLSEDVERIILSTNSQLHASGQGMICERRQLLAAQQQRNKEFELRLVAAKAEADAAIQRLQINNEAHLKKMREDNNRDIGKLSMHCENLKNELEISRAARQNDKDAADKILAMERDLHMRSIDKLKKKATSTNALTSDGGKCFGEGSSPKTNYPLSVRDSARKGRRTPRPEGNHDEVRYYRIPPIFTVKLTKHYVPYCTVQRRIGDHRKTEIEGLTAVIDTLIAQVESAHKERSIYQRC